MLELTAEQARAVICADNFELWQEDDRRTTNKYLADVFGLSDPVCDMTAEANVAHEAGLIELVIGLHGSRWWKPTTIGDQWLARAEQESDR